MLMNIVKREYLNIPKESDFGVDMFLGFNKSNMVSFNLIESGNVLITTGVGYGKTNVLNSLVNSLVKDNKLSVNILDTKNVLDICNDNDNVEIYKGDDAVNQINNLYGKFMEEELEELHSMRTIIIDELSGELSSNSEIMDKLLYMVHNGSKVSWHFIIATSASRFADNIPLFDLFGTVIAARSPIKLVKCRFPEKMSNVKPGVVFISVNSSKPIKVNIPLTDCVK